VKDVARGTPRNGLSQRVYNIALGRASSNRDILDAVRRVVPDACCAALTPGRTPGASTPARDLSRSKGEVGYQPQHTLETGIAAYVEWLRGFRCLRVETIAVDGRTLDQRVQGSSP
jgi:nucleoside-diphosphate-sugar epimerase